MSFFLGLSTGIVVVYLLMADRVADHGRFSEIRIRDFKDAFDKGYQTKNGYKPFIAESEEKEEAVVSTATEYEQLFGFDFEEEDIQNKKTERWDD